MKKNLLFICTENLDRSPTAERLFLNNRKYEAKSAGTSATASTLLSWNSIKWADIIFVMEEKHKDYLEKTFKNHGKEINVLGIPDCYHENDKKLVCVLKDKLKKYLN